MEKYKYMVVVCKHKGAGELVVMRINGNGVRDKESLYTYLNRAGEAGWRVVTTAWGASVIVTLEKRGDD